jgi:hypothetical protein
MKFTAIQSTLLLSTLLLLAGGCTSNKSLEQSPYRLIGQSNLNLALISSGEKANNPDVSATHCKLYLFINPHGEPVDVSARLRKSKNYNSAQDLRYLGYAYQVKFKKNNRAIKKISKPIACQNKTNWLVENMKPGYGVKLFIVWEGYWNGVEEVGDMLISQNMVETFKIGTGGSQLIVGLGFEAADGL